MGLLDLNAAQADTAAPNPLQALPRTAGERFSAEVDATQAPDRYFSSAGARRDLWQKSADQLYERTGQRFENPYGAPTPEELGQHVGVPSQPIAVQEARRQRIIDAYRVNFPDRTDDTIDPENIDRHIAEESIRRRDKAASYVGTGNGLAAFFGGAVGETMTPHGVVGLMVPVTRLPSAAASAVGRTFLGNVAREAAFQAGANVGIQAAAEGLDFASRREFGTEQTIGEVAGNLAGAAVIGAAVGGGVRALHLKWLGLPEAVRANAPLEVKDAFRVIEADSLYTGQNRLGVDPLLHERYQGQAADAVMRGQPVTLSDLSRTADTPLTALGTILRQAPDTIRADISGLGNALDRIRSLPDSEIEAVARELKPQSFARLDRITQEINDARGQLEEMRKGLETITIADMADPLTSARLRDIEDKLAAPALRREERLQLERERDMITETIDPKGTMAKDLERVRQTLETPEEKTAREALTERVEALERERTSARSEVDREVDFLRSKLDSAPILKRFADDVEPDVLAREFGTADVPTLGEAIARAEVARQARVLRELGAGEVVSPQVPTTAEIAAASKEIPPEQTKALQLESDRVLEARPGMEVQIDGRSMSAAKAMEEADQLAKDARAALNCAMGSL